MAQASHVVPCGSMLVTGSFRYLAGMAAAVSHVPKWHMSVGEYQRQAYRTFSVMWLTLGTGCTLVLFKHQDNVDSWFQKVSWVKGVFDHIIHPSLLHMVT